MKRSKPVQSTLDSFQTKRVKLTETEESKTPEMTLAEILKIPVEEYKETDFKDHFVKIAQFIIN